MEEHCRIGYLARYAFTLSAGYRQGVSGIRLKAAHLPCTRRGNQSVQQAASSSVEQLSVEILFGNEKASDAHGN